MDIWIFITAGLIALSGIVVTCLAFWRYFDLKHLMKRNKEVNGRITLIKEIRNQNGNYSYYQLVYSVDGKEYRHKFLTRSDKYHNNQDVSVFYLPDKPRIWFIERENRSFRPDSFRALIFALDMIFVFALVILFLQANHLHTVIDFSFWGFFYITLWVWLVDEYNRINKSKTTTGTIVYAARNKHTRCVIAEYTVGNRTYETRQMIVPLKKNSRNYSVNNAIEVKYKEKHPYSAIIIDDIYEYKKAELALIVVSIGIAITIMIYL